MTTKHTSQAPLHTAVVEQDADGHYFITFPPELLAELGWVEGTTIQWIDNQDGTFTIQKVAEETNAGTD